jgi:PIN domain nuclease of toxin-antitoxin system
MRVLLDTHTLIWLVTDIERLGEDASTIILDPTVEKLLSPASYWEMAVKIRKGKLTLTEELNQFIDNAIDLNRLVILPVAVEHAHVLSQLGLQHGDPFDLMLISQAIVEDIPVVSIDDAFDNYDVQRVW